MMRMRKKEVKGMSTTNSGGGERGTPETEAEWEVRPGGMLVQKRNMDSDKSPGPVPTIRVRVKYKSTYHEINISPQATFGELKRMLTGPTGLHHEDQKLIYKDKERDSKAFLDITGVKDNSKIVLLVDPIRQESRLLEMRRNAKMEKAAKSIYEIGLEVDRLAGQVSGLESVICEGGKVEETLVLNLIELLMNQLLKLDSVIAEGDVKLRQTMQVQRVQKYVEILDTLKIRSSTPSQNVVSTSMQNQKKFPKRQQRLAPIQEQERPSPTDVRQSMPGLELFPTPQQLHPSRNSSSTVGEVVITTQWEIFDSTPPRVPVSLSDSTANSLLNQPIFFPWD